MNECRTWVLVVAIASLSGCAGQSETGAVAEALVSEEGVPEAQWRAIEPIACGDAEGVTEYRHAEGADELVVGIDARGMLRCIDTLSLDPTWRATSSQGGVITPLSEAVDPEPQPMVDWTRSSPHGGPARL